MTKAIAAFDPRRPHETIPILLQARRLLRSLEGDLAARKLRELDEMVAKCAGMLLEAAVQRPHATAGSDRPHSACRRSTDLPPQSGWKA
jgi:hypothetical protein